MNAILVLPELDTNSFWHDKSGFPGIYDVDHFIKSLKNDVDIVMAPPAFRMVANKKKKLKAFQLRPPRDALPEWYTTVALEKMKEYGAVYLTPFSHRLAEEIKNDEFQRLRCRVNFHALRFNKDIMSLSQLIVRRLRLDGYFMAIHLRFELDMLAFAGCLAIFTPDEQEILRKYRKENFAEKRLVHDERRMIGKCPLTPEEVIICSLYLFCQKVISFLANLLEKFHLYMYEKWLLERNTCNRLRVLVEKDMYLRGRGL
ncbi:hypothetical protein L7F22_046204 [Adiantum nelumboides]|nr:hypothetical protein [Adiantum nelumboides]